MFLFVILGVGTNKSFKYGSISSYNLQRQRYQNKNEWDNNKGLLLPIRDKQAHPDIVNKRGCFGK